MTTIDPDRLALARNAYDELDAVLSLAIEAEDVLAVRGLLKRARALAWLIHAAPDLVLASTDELRAGLEGDPR